MRDARTDEYDRLASIAERQYDELVKLRAAVARVEELADKWSKLGLDRTWYTDAADGLRSALRSES